MIIYKKIPSYRRILKESVEIDLDYDDDGDCHLDTPYNYKDTESIVIANERKIRDTLDNIANTIVVPSIKSITNNDFYSMDNYFDNIYVKDSFYDIDHGYNNFNHVDARCTTYWIPVTGTYLGSYKDFLIDLYDMEHFAINVLDGLRPILAQKLDGVISRIRLGWFVDDYYLAEWYDENETAIDEAEEKGDWDTLDEIYSTQPESGIAIGVCLELSDEYLKSL